MHWFLERHGSPRVQVTIRLLLLFIFGHDVVGVCQYEFIASGRINFVATLLLLFSKLSSTTFAAADSFPDLHYADHPRVIFLAVGINKLCCFLCLGCRSYKKHTWFTPPPLGCRLRLFSFDQWWQRVFQKTQLIWNCSDCLINHLSRKWCAICGKSSRHASRNQSVKTLIQK